MSEQALYLAQAWQDFKPKYQVFEWDDKLSKLKEENPKHYTFLTTEQMCETPIKFFTSAIKTLTTEVFDSEFSITLGIYIDGAITTVTLAPELSYKFMSYVDGIDPKSKENRKKPTYNELVKMMNKDRDAYILNHVGVYDVPLTIMMNSKGDVGGLGSGIAHGIFSVPIIEEIEKIVFETFTKEELKVSYKFLGYKDGVRVTYELAKPVVLPDPIGEVKGLFSFITRNDFHTALSGYIGLIRDKCLNVLYIGGGSGNDVWYSDAGEKIPYSDTKFYITHKTPFEKAKEELKEKLPKMVKALKFSPNMLEKTLSVKIDYSDAILFLEDMRTLPRRDGLEIFDSLTKALKTKRDRRGHLTLYDLIEKLSECASEYSPIAKNAKWDRHLANIRFKCGQALTKEMFESELEAMDELKTKRKAKEESKLKAKFARYKHDVKEQIDKTKADLERAKKKDDKVKIKQHKDILKKYKTKETHIKIMEHLKIKTFKEFAEKSKSWENGEYTDKELEFFNEHLKYKKLFSKET